MADAVTLTSPYSVVVGDMGPALQLTLLVSGTPFALNFTTDTVSLRYQRPDGSTAQKLLSVVGDGSAGQVQATWTAGDLPLVGAYRALVVVSRSTDPTFPRTFPNDGSVVIWNVYQSIPSGVPGTSATQATYYGFQEQPTDPLPANVANYLYLDAAGDLHVKASGQSFQVAYGSGGGDPGAIPVFNVKAYGATGDGATDDTINIQKAITAAAIAGGGAVYFPNGTYVVSSAVASTPCFNLPANLTLIGESKEGVVVKMAAGQGASVRMFQIQANDVCIRNMTLDGNQANQTVDEHRAGVFCWNSNRVVVEDVIIHDFTGDAVDVYIAINTVIQRCYCYNNNRKAVSLNGGPSAYTWIRDCYFENNNGQVHIESSTTVEYLWFEDCYVGEPSLGGLPVSMGGVGVHVYLSGLVINGGLQITNISDCHVSDCTVTTGPQGASGPAPLSITYAASDITVDRCTFVQNAAQGSANYIAQIESASSQSSSRPSNVILSNNTFTTTYSLANGISLINVGDVQIVGNRIVQTVPSGGFGIAVSSTDTGYAAPQVGVVVCDGNYFDNWSVGVGVSGSDNSHTIGALTCTGNVFSSGPSNTTKNFRLGGASTGAYTGLLQCTLVGNTSVGVTTEFASFPACPILVGGARQGGGIYSCAGSPNNQIAENVGAMALQRDGSGSVGWLKTSGSGNTGWQSLNVT